MSSAPNILASHKFKIEIAKGPHAGASYFFDKDTVTIGRGPENDIVLANDARVSRQHAEIKLNGKEHYVLNLSQKNYILVNGNRVQSERLEQNTTILIGESEIKYSVDRPVPVAPRPIAVPTPEAFTPPSPNTSSLPTFGGAMPMQNRPVPPPAPAQYQYQPPPPQGGMNQARVPSPAGGGLFSNPKARFYMIIGVLLLLCYFVFSAKTNGPRKDPNAIRTNEQVTEDMQTADKLIEQLEKRKKQMNEVQYSRAQENFIKGFRDFQQGQYARARESFQVTLNLDPDNDLAKRYLQLSKIKFDEMVKFSMIQGSRYREKKSWRMCQSSFFNVMTMLQNRKDDPTYMEAKRYYDECSLNTEGRF